MSFHPRPRHTKRTLLVAPADLIAPADSTDLGSCIRYFSAKIAPVYAAMKWVWAEAPPDADGKFSAHVPNAREIEQTLERLAAHIVSGEADVASIGGLFCERDHDTDGLVIGFAIEELTDVECAPPAQEEG